MAGSGTSALDNATKMAAFYTDSSMKTMKSEAEFKTAWMAMSKDDQAMMMNATRCTLASMRRAGTAGRSAIQMAASARLLRNTTVGGMLRHGRPLPG